MRILLPIWRGAPERCFYQDFHAGMIEAIREFGHEALPFSHADIGRLSLHNEGNALLQQVSAARPGAVLDIACWSYALTRLTVGPTSAMNPIFDAFEIPYVGWLFDHPYNQALNGAAGRRLHAVYPDLGHPSQVRLVYPQYRPVREIFGPPAVRPANDRSAQEWATNRDIDVLYVGNLVPGALQRIWNRRGEWLVEDSVDSGLCDSIVDAVLAEPEQSLHVCSAAAISHARAGTDFHANLRLVEFYLRHAFRHAAVVALGQAGVRLQVVGDGWGSVALPPGIRVHPATDYAGLFGFAARAKICLDASTYVDGANDRVFSYGLNRAVCFTNASGFLRGAMGEEAGLRFYSMRRLDDLGESVKQLLSRPAGLREAGERARLDVLAAHTWRHRIGGILSAMGLL